MDATSFTRLLAKSCCAFLIAGSVFAGPLNGPIDPTLPIDLPPTKPALPGMPSVEPIMIDSMLGFMISTPIIAFNNTGVLNYTVADGLLAVDADPLAILLNNVDPPSLVFPGSLGADLMINIILASDGSLVGGIPGDDLIITGAVDLTGDMIPDVDGVLLTGEVTEYMGEDSGGPTDFHAYRFNVTGGFLAGPFGSDIAIELTSEMSTFTGNYNVDFSGEAKGDIGVVECTGTIGDFVWLDLDGNGIQDDGEDGIPNVQIILTDLFGNVTTTVTDANGFYQFPGLCAGTYTVSVNPDSLPPDVAVTLINAPGSNDANDSNDPAGTTVTLPNNDSMDQDTDFGYVPVTSALGDYVWEDLNMDGIQDSNEPPIEGVMVNLYDCEGDFIASDVTDAAGAYFFDNLPAGCYRVEFILPAGFVFTLMDQNGEALDSDPDPTTGFTDEVELAPGETNPDVDAGMFQPSTAELGDRFWEDLNGDGIQDPGEPGIVGVPVNLYDCTGNLLDSTTTGANGMYLFADLDAGCYVVGFEPPDMCILTAQDAGINDADDSDADPVTGLTDQINLADGQSDLTWDGGCYYTAGLGDFVWNDLDQDGIQDPGEPGIPDLLVVLLDENMMETGLSTTTGPAGEYEFTGLPPGSYFVQFTSPPGFVFSPQDQGVDDSLDSDANGTGKSDKIILESGDFDPTIDAGVYEPFAPCIDIEKSTNGFDADNPTGPFIPTGDPVLWEYVVSNCGNVALTDVFVIDDQGVAVDCMGQDTLAAAGQPGDTFTCIGNGSATIDQYENQGDTCGIDPAGTQVCADDPSHYFGSDPSIDIEKLTNGVDADDPNAGDAPPIAPGDPVTWTYIVTNTGNVPLSNIMVVDDQGVLVNCPRDELGSMESMNCTATGTAEDLPSPNVTNVTGMCPEGFPDRPLYENIGTATGEPEVGDTVQDVDPSHYCNPPAPGIDIEKLTNGVDADDPNAGDAPQIAPGDTVTWTYIVTNTGDVALSDVSVTDNQGVAVDCMGQNTLAPAGQPGDSFTCTATGLADDLLDAAGTVPGMCGSNGPDAPLYENMGTATGQTADGDTVQDVDPSHYCNPPAPSIDIEKLTNGIDADDPNAGDAPQIAPGDLVVWTYIVTNTGNVTLTDVTVMDDELVVVSCLITELAPGASFTCTGSALAEDLLNTSSTTVPGMCGSIPETPLYENMGSVTGQAVTGEFVDDVDPSHYCNPPVPAIDIEKATNGIDADDANAGDAPQIQPGDTVTWTYVVTNTGNVALSNVSVTDDQGVAVDCMGQNTLAPAGQPGDSFTCTASGVAEDLLTAGGTVPGMCPEGFPGRPLYENMGTATGQAANGDTVQDVDPSHYCNPPVPSIDIEKATNGIDADDANAGDAPQILPGDTVTWTYVVTNTGNVALSNVSVTDNQGVAVDCMGQNTLAPAGQPGDSFTCTASGVAEDLLLTGGTVPGLCGDGFPNTPMYENMGTATGQAANGNTVQDVDPSHYCNPPVPSIDIEKATNGIDADDANAGDAPQIQPGDTVTWTYIVTNTGNVPLFNVTVVDDQGVAVDCMGQNTLAPAGQPGDSFTCTASGVAEDLLSAGGTVPGLCGEDFPQTPMYENMGTATGQTANGDPVRDEDPSHYCNPQTPSIDIEKATNGIDADDANAGDAPQILPGDTVTWTYIVTNTGNVPLTGVTVGDDQGVAVDCMGQNTLAPAGQPGDSFTCTASGLADDLMTAGGTVPGMCGSRPNTPLYENTGSVVGTTPGGATVADNDPSHYCNPEVCALTVNKTCLIPMPPASNFTCDKPIDSLTMIYNGTQPVRIKAWKGPVGSTLLADMDDIQPNEEVTVMGYAGSPNDVFWEVFLAGTDSKIGESKFHLSCSDSNMNGPEDCGLPQGDGKDDDSNLLNVWLLEGMVDASGTLDCTPPATTGVSDCEFQTFPASCETGDADFLTLQYTGGGCGASDNSQDDHVCSGSVDGTASATFTDDDGNSVTLNPGDTVTIPRNLAKNMTLSNAGGTQTNELHTSCSQPIVAGDVYGGLTLVQIDGMGIGTDVVYAYEITNSSNVNIVSLSAIDNVLGPIPGAPSSLGAGQTVVLNASAFLTETTTNTAIVDGDTVDGQMCHGTDTATVTILPPPPCDVDGEGLLEVSSDKIKWNLTNNGAFTATIESLEISWPNANGDLIEIKLDGDNIYNLVLPPNSATIGPNDWINDLHKRQIPPGDTDTLEIKFDNNVVGPQDAYSITVNFEEGCSVTFENTGLPFECNTDITELTMIWDGNQTIGVRAWYGDVGDTLLHTQNNVTVGTEVTVSGYAGSQNDVYWEILSGNTVIGESNFHMSCSDNEMNGAEDCGNRQGNGKGNDSNLINDWLLEGMVDADGPFDCSNLP